MARERFRSSTELTREEHTTKVLAMDLLSELLALLKTIDVDESMS